MMTIGEMIMAASQNRVREVYHRHGIEPHIGLGGIVSEHRTLALYSPSFARLQPDFPPNTCIVGFPFFDSESGQDAVLDRDLQAFLNSGSAPIVFSLGTAVVYGGEHFFRRAIVAAQRSKARCVILARPESPLLDEDFGNQVFVTDYAPHSLLFPRASVVVHHGGIGSTAQALASGRPQLVTPVFGDQFDNARRLAEMGVARVLPYTSWRVSSAITRLRSLLTDRRFSECAARSRPVIADEDGARTAADLLLR
jgi:UDP:flavonoid glycosyltransferase YjiC (YdhE family)